MTWVNDTIAAIGVCLLGFVAFVVLFGVVG